MAEQYASIIIDISHENVDRIFQYRIPESLAGEVGIGTQVCVPFGAGNRVRKGYVVDITGKLDYDPGKVKEIAGVVEGSVTADTRLIRLAWWMKERYGSTMNQALKTVLPVKRRVKARNQKVVDSLVGLGGGLPSEAESKAVPGTDVKGAPEADAKESPKTLPETSEGPLTGPTQATPAAPLAAPPAELNAEQQAILSQFTEDYDRGERIPYLIHGITGSGKTEVYMAMIDHVLGQGRQVIVLIPEIALTYQTVMRFYRRFGEKICVMHSRLSAGERYDQFARARKGETQIMIGARSALFTPFPDIGLIVIDEEHEGAYKSEGAPRYHAREVAEELARMNDAQLVLGSATPSLEAYTKAEAGLYRLFTLRRRAGSGSHLASVEVVDLRRELEAGNKSIFSRRLKGLMEERLAAKEQIMLFMNRRGYSNFVSCRSCGEAVKCPHCDVSLTLHNRNRLVCHYCGYTVPLPAKCPSCGSEYLAGFGIGTQQVEALTRNMFPEARVLRMDLDTTSRKGGHETILAAFARGEADILIGTQMIVKGHDFPGVTLVGILAADVSLYAPDYRCAERTFQLLVQAAGRAGRGRKPGTAVIQTYMPEHYGIRGAASQNYEAFYRQEMGFRRLMHYPPSCHMLGLQVSGKEEELVSHIMEQIHHSVARNFGGCVELIGPVPAPVYKVNDIYRKILYLKQENYDILIRIQKYVQDRWEETAACRTLNIQYDFS